MGKLQVFFKNAQSKAVAILYKWVANAYNTLILCKEKVDNHPIQQLPT
jgi:hypothetical protein